MLRIGIPDIISPSYFPAVAAANLGYMKEAGYGASALLVTPVDKTMAELRDGNLEFAIGCAHSVPSAFPNWEGAKVIAPVSHGTYWFLVVRTDLDVSKEDLSGLSGCNIGAAPLVDLSLQKILADLGIEDVNIGPVPGAFLGEDLNFGLAAAKALEAGLIDGFWANGMGAEVAVRSGAGKLVLDARRGDGPEGTSLLTFSAVITTEKMIADRTDEVRAMIRGIRTAQSELRRDPKLAQRAVVGVFGEYETSLIAELIKRDAPYYQPEITQEMINSCVDFQVEMGVIAEPVSFDQMVATVEV